jgi:serine/threonine protein kinase
MALETNSILNNRYKILDVLGKGGMGAIYRAEDQSLGVTVAVKENLYSSQEATRQFKREASILAGLRHPNLPRVTDHFVIPEVGQYLVMDFIEGEDLRQRLQRVGKLSEQEVIYIGVSIADALNYLHNLQPPVLHRDIKPGNIKVTPQGQIMLVDFGLAKVVQGDQATTTGAQSLTPGYAPPEQYGQGTDARSDIYSLGATLYAALTGKVPEDGISRAMGTVQLTPVKRHMPRINSLLAESIERSMTIDPSQRFQTALDFKTALQKIDTSEKTISQPVSELRITPGPSAGESTRAGAKKQVKRMKAIIRVSPALKAVFIISGIFFLILTGLLLYAAL